MNKETWTALSPKAGLLYKFTNSITAYLDASRGFRSGTISDLCQTADVSQGFKIANPALKPEYLSNIEAGSIIQLGKFEIEPILFYSIGKDFQYFLGTGDSIYTLKTKEEPIIERENINKVVIYGAELAANYSINHYIILFANYTYDHAQIRDFDTNSTFTTNLTNKLLSNSPMNIVYSGVQIKTKVINISFTYRYVSSFWANDANTQKVNGYSLFDAKVSKTFYNKLRLSAMIQNIFNNLYLDSKGNIPPGRFITVELKYNF
jgi:outer membrane receptor protein involved in Fe transport